MLLQLVPLHSPQAIEQLSPCFLHVHRFESQLTLQPHLMIVSNLSGAAGKSIFTGTNLFSTLYQPHSISFNLWSSQVWTCKYTLLLWYFAAELVGGNVCTWTTEVLTFALWTNFLYLRWSNPLSSMPPYTFIKAHSPAFSISSMDESFMNTAPHCFSSILVDAFFRTVPFPTPNILEVLSHPVNAWIKGNKCLVSSPITCLTLEMFHTLAFFILTFTSDFM